MYFKYFGLKEPSFSIAPDPEYLFLSEQHKEALAHLLYGAGESGGFVLLTGEVGTGKTTVCRAFLEQIPDGVDMALILNPAMTANELMLAICDEFRIEVPERERSVKSLVDRLNAYLLDAHARGRRPVLMIDEAQNLRPKVLEQIRLLTNLETTKQKLLQIFLVGQPELRTLLSSRGLRQLNQRITARFHLTPLSRGETGAYIRHRLMVAGVDRPLFTRAAIKRIHNASNGVPRLTNVLCDRALLGACVRRAALVTAPIVDQAVKEVKGENEPVIMPRPRPVFTWSLATALLVLALFVGWHARDWIGGVADLPLPDRIVALLPIAKSANDGERPTPVEPGAVDEVAVDEPRPAAPVDPVETVETVGTDASTEARATRVDRPADEPAVDPAAVQPVAEVAETDASPRLEGSPGQAEDMDLGVVADVPDEQRPEPADLGDGGGESQPALLQLTDADLERLTMNRADALRVMLRRWDVALGDVGRADPCLKIATFGLRCENERGDWPNVRYFDRPAVIRISGGKGYAVIGALGAEIATVDGFDGREPVALSALDAVWTSEYTLVWQPPPFADVSTIGPRSSRAAVAWLRKLVSRVPELGLSDVDSGAYSTDLRQAVRRFQIDRGLSADGIAGPRTLVQFHNAVAMPGIPRLSD